MKEAQKAFQKVIDNYPRQIDAVKVAKEKLTRMMKAKTVLEKGDREFAVRKIGPGHGFGCGEISPDGRYITYVEWDTGDLAAQELTTGKKRYLTHKEGSWDKSSAMAYNSRWSPDGKHIAYDWWTWDKKPYFVGIRIASPEGSDARAIYQVSPELVSYTLGWSPDGKYLLAAIRNPSRANQLVLISVDDGSVRILKPFDFKRNFLNANFSPDGKYIIYEKSQEENLLNNDMYLLSIDEGKEMPLITHQADDHLLGCAPDGKSVLFASDRRGTIDAWLIQLEDGEVKGTARLIKESLGEVEPLGFTDNGSFYYVSAKSEDNVYVAHFDPETWKVIDTPKRDTEYLGKSSHSPAYSPDGKYLAYISERGASSKSRFVICLRDLETGKEKEFFPGHWNLMDLKWSPDSRFLLTRARDKKEFGPFWNDIICKVDTKKGDVETIIQSEEDKNNEITHFINSADWSTDGKSIFYVIKYRADKTCRLIKRNLQSGLEKTIYSAASPQSFYILSRSPDGEWIAFVEYDEEDNRTLKVIPSAGGDARDLNSFKTSVTYITHLSWTPNGKYILYQMPEAKLDELLAMPFSGGKPQKLGLKMAGINHLSIHPDGKRVAFSSYGSSKEKPEIWVMENFLPKDKREGKGGQR
jgi:Tol biopolymer transport system component